MLLTQLKKPKQKLAEKSVIPLINIVFLLIIFFMITVPFSTIEQLELPKLDKTLAKPLPYAQAVTLTKTAEIVIDNRPYTNSQLREWLFLNTQQGLNSILIKAHASLPAEHLLNLLQELSHTNLDVKIVTQVTP